MNLDISVIITVHNETFEQISRAILSAKACNVKEILVINSGSTRENTNIYSTFCKQNNIQIINIENDKGICDTRNVGIRHSIGKYLTFLDADDELSEEWINDFQFAEKFNPDLIMFSIFMRTNNKDLLLLAKDVNSNVIINSNENSFCSLFKEGFLILNDKHLFNRAFLLKNDILFKIDRLRGEDSVFMADCLSKNISVFSCNSIFQIYNNQKELKLNKDFIVNEIESLYYCYTKFKNTNCCKIYAEVIMETIKARKKQIILLSKEEICEIDLCIRKLNISNISFKNKLILKLIKIIGLRTYFKVRG